MTRKKTTDYFCISEKRSQKTWRKSSKERDSSRISQRDNPREGEKKKENKEKQTTHEIRFWSQASRKICRSRSHNLESIGGAQSKDTANARSDLCFSKSAPLTSGRSPLNPRKEKPARFFFFPSYARGFKLDVTSSLQGIRRLLLAAYYRFLVTKNFTYIYFSFCLPFSNIFVLPCRCISNFYQLIYCKINRHLCNISSIVKFHRL